MNDVVAHPVLGVALHAVGAFLAATCYTPQKKVQGWSWQSYWITQATVCWFLLPIIGAALTIPDLVVVLREAPRDAMVNTFLLGALYGVGGTAFGISIRYIGFSLTYAIAVGLSSVLGTLVPPIVRGMLGETLSGPGADRIVAGLVVGTVGIAVTGLAGRLKEIDLEAGRGRGEFSLSKGLAISMLAGVLSAVYGLSLEAGDAIANAATTHGAGVWRGNVIYIFSNTGAFLTTATYCLFLHVRHGTLGELVGSSAGWKTARFRLNLALATLTGFLWYGQFFFYNLGHVRMGRYEFTSWAIHMTMLVLFSNLVGLVLREWRGCRRRAHLTLGAALSLLLGAVLLVTYGSRLGELAAR